MNLLTHLNSLPLLRPLDFPRYARHICLIVLEEHLEYVQAIMDARPAAELEYLVLPDFDGKKSPHEYRFQRRGQSVTVPVGGMRSLLGMPHLEKVYFSPPGDSFGHCLVAISRSMAPHGIRTFYVCLSQPLTYIGSMRDPAFYHNNVAELTRVYASLADESSREVYAARIKAMITGEAGYLPLAAHAEYFHPLVSPQAGDVMIDGGVSDRVAVQEAFAASVGETGKIFGFEPIPEMFAVARKKLAELGQYQLLCAGLGRKREQLRFDLLRDSSHVSAGEEGAGDTVLCDMLDIDSFVEEQGLDRVDCIKLDVEGSELAALKGARKTLRAHRPKLIICLYHKMRDVIDIPAYIKATVPEYELYIAHSSFHFIDTVLYAKVRD